MLPFLLVFTIVFAILEKTRVLGIDKIDNKEYTKKNLNAIVAFVVAFLVIASTTLVRIINEVVANVVLLIILVISFLMLVGIFLGTGETTLEKYPGWLKFFMIILFIAIVAILLRAMGWLQVIWDIFALTPTTDWAATLVLLVIVIIVMIYVTQDSGGSSEKKKEGH